MLENIKLLLGLAADDAGQDAKLQLIISTVTARLRALLGGIEPPESMDYIIMEVAVIRFNRIGSEGVTSHSVEGESYQFADDDFAAYSDDIQAFLDTQGSGARGRVRFL